MNNTLNNKQSINLYSQSQFHYNHKINEHILKTLYQKSVRLADPTKK